MSVDEQRALGRAKNSVLDYLHKRLAVPKIFLDRTWGEQVVDVLAIDRDGVGDVSAVQMLCVSFSPEGQSGLNRDARDVMRIAEALQTVQAHYKYIAIVRTKEDHFPYRFHDSQSVKERTFSPDGLGRVGFLTIVLSEDGETETQLVVKPERFRAFIARQADQFIRTTPADWEIRPDPVTTEDFHV